MTPVLFADYNVLIQALFIPQSAAYIIAEMVARGAFDLATCQLCVDDTEDAIIAKLENKPDSLNEAIKNWGKLKSDTRLVILQDPDAAAAQKAYDKYMGVMRHIADIPVLAAALSMDQDRI